MIYAILHVANQDMNRLKENLEDQHRIWKNSIHRWLREIHP